MGKRKKCRTCPALWGASLHFARNLAHTDAKHYADFEVMGDVLAAELDEPVYSVGFTVGRGKTSQVTQETAWKVKSVGRNSFGRLMEVAGFEHAFLDLRKLPPGGHWLQGKLLMLCIGFGYYEFEWPSYLDGVVYSREGEAARLREEP